MQALLCMRLQVYEKRVSCLSNFNIENRNGISAGGRTPAVNMPRLTQQSLHLPKVQQQCTSQAHGGHVGIGGAATQDG